MSKYRLAIANVVGVTVEGSTLQEDGSAQPFKFVLAVERLSREEILEQMTAGGSITGFFAQRAKGWRDQTLVHNTEDGQPASFGPEAMEAMFSIPNVAALCWEAYKAQAGAIAKN